MKTSLEIYTKLSEDAEFGDRKSQIRDRLVVGILDKEISRKLQLEDSLTLDHAIATVRQAEQVKSDINNQLSLDQLQLNVVSNTSRSHRFGNKNYNNNAMSYNNNTRHDNTRYAQGGTGAFKRNQCGRCDLQPAPKSCPAYDAVCRSCKKKGHYSRCCQTRTRAANELVDADNQDNQYFVDAIDAHTGPVNAIDKSQPWYTTVYINEEPFRFKLDTGADVTVMTKSEYNRFIVKPKLFKSDVTLVSVNSNVKVFGFCMLDIKYKSNYYNLKVYVADCHTNLLSRSAATNLSMLKRLEALGVVQDTTASITMMSDVKPICVSSPRRLPFAIIPKVDVELDKMLHDGVIKEVTEPTDWCSHIVPVDKPNGQVRICVDLRAVNRAVKRENYPIPSFDEIVTKLKGAKVFSSLDAKSGYHQILLDEGSCKITSFITHRGRFCFKNGRYH